VEFRRRLSTTVACLAALATIATGIASAKPPSLRSMSSAGAVSSRSLAIRRPMGVVAGDVLVAGLGVRLSARAPILAPSGWILIRRDTNDLSHVRLGQALYYKIAGPSEPSDYVWKWTSARRFGAAGGIFDYSGVDVQSPIEAYSGGCRSQSTRIVAPSMVIRSDGAALLGFFGEAGRKAITAPTSMTRRFDRSTKSGASAVRLMGATRAAAGAGETGDRVASISGSRGGSTIGQLVALRAARGPVSLRLPVNVAAPSITGTPQVGRILAANAGSWTSYDTITYAFQWLRCDATGSSCAALSGSTAQSYSPTTVDAGAEIRLRVTATNTGGSTSAMSLAVGPVVAAAPFSFTPSLADPFPPGSFWVRPLPADPAVDPQSADRISYWLSKAGTFDLTLRRYAVADAIASPTDPLYSIATCTYTCRLDLWGAFHIPAGTQADPGSDGHLAIFDPATEREWGMWQAQYNSTTNTWTAGSGAALDLSTAIAAPADVSGANDANFPALAGIVRPEELAAGHIDHPLVYETPARAKGAARCPATANHGIDTTSLALPDGALLQLDPSLDVNSLAIPAWEKVIARALQVYGMYIRDGSSGSTDLIGENTINRGDQWTTLLGWTGDYEYFSSAFPWSRMRVLAPPC